MFLTSSDSKRTLMHQFLLTIPPKRTGFNMYAEYTQPQLTFLALHPLKKRGSGLNWEVLMIL